MPNQSKLLVLVDGSSYLYRAFHALPALTNSKGFPTGAVYGMVNMLKRLIADFQPGYMAVVFDAKGKTFRDEIYKAYKATRQEMPSELAQQIAPIHQIIEALGLPLVMVEGVEADDVIGTLTTHAKKAGFKTLISTSDKDLAQLVDDDVTLINTMSNTTLTPEGVINKFGVAPARIIDYLTLVGDSSDNIPGVPSVGPKTAAKWLNQYQSLDNLVAHAAEIGGKVGENFRASLAQFPLVKQLVTIKMDVKLSINFTDLAIKTPNKPNLSRLYKEMEFKTWLSELLAETKDDNDEKYKKYETITMQSAFDDFIERLKQYNEFAFDIETNSTDYMQARLVGLAFALAPGVSIYVPFGHDYPGAPAQLTKTAVLKKIKPILENPAIKKIGQNLKYDIQVLASENIHLAGGQFDTMLEAYVLDSTSATYDLDALALKYLGRRTISFQEVAGKGSKQVTFNQIDLATASKIAAEDADVTLQLHQLLLPRIETVVGLERTLTEIEMPLVNVLAHMERHGVLIDKKKLEQQGQALSKRLTELEQQVFVMAGKSFNMNSPKQLQEVLFQDLKLPVLQKTPTGQASTADPVLQELAIDYALPRLIIEYRSLSKLMTTYINRLPEQIEPLTGRLHTSYNQTGTGTGRLSSSEPNLQNIPIRTAEGRRIRQAFVAPSGYQILSADYSQIELRLMAHLSEDPNLIDAFKQNLDIHTATAAEVWGVALATVTPEMRRNAKAINFGLIYGMSAFGLTRQLGIDRKSAQDYIDRYFKRYPNVKAYMEASRTSARLNGYVETLWGRRLYIPDINASQMMRQKAAERAAINAPLQGSAADIIKMAMVAIDRWLNTEKVDAKMIMQVHDELVFEVATDILPVVEDKIRALMTGIVTLNVPLLVATGKGANWDLASAH